MGPRLGPPLWTIAAVATALPLSAANAAADPLLEVHDVKGVDLGHVEEGIAPPLTLAAHPLPYQLCWPKQSRADSKLGRHLNQLLHLRFLS